MQAALGNTEVARLQTQISVLEGQLQVCVVLAAIVRWLLMYYFYTGSLAWSIWRT